MTSTAATASVEPRRAFDGQATSQSTLSSAELLRGQREVLIHHGEETYRLRLTRNGKLILHK